MAWGREDLVRGVKFRRKAVSPHRRCGPRSPSRPGHPVNPWPRTSLSRPSTPTFRASRCRRCHQTTITCFDGARLASFCLTPYPSLSLSLSFSLSETSVCVISQAVPPRLPTCPSTSAERPLFMRQYSILRMRRGEMRQLNTAAEFTPCFLRCPRGTHIHYAQPSDRPSNN